MSDGIDFDFDEDGNTIEVKKPDPNWKPRCFLSSCDKIDYIPHSELYEQLICTETRTTPGTACPNALWYFGNHPRLHPSPGITSKLDWIEDES